jgi:hypothetical protein
MDHDVNILDKAAYINEVLRPALSKLTGPAPVLGFEKFLSRRRQMRTRRVGPLLDIGREDIPMFLLLFAYLGGSWYVRVAVSEYAGEGAGIYDALLYLASIVSIISVVMSILIGANYRTIGRV